MGIFKKKDERKMKTYSVLVYADGSQAMDLTDFTFIKERDMVYIHSKLTNISLGINVNTLSEFLNINRPDLFQEF